MAVLAGLFELSACAQKPAADVATESDIAREDGPTAEILSVRPRPRPIKLTAPRHKVCGPDYRLFEGKCLSRLETWHLRGAI
jgi:hypothetical protein